uniref:BAR domain-containing protein n=1 Tax=Panthera tigris altaica TaxID=74533 RepID=A0A8C9KNB5_PANTA
MLRCRVAPLVFPVGLLSRFHPFELLVSEKVGGAEGTKLDEDFKEMEKKVDVTSKAVTEVLARTIEYLQPNPEMSLGSSGFP